MLAFWCGPNPARIERLFAMSGLGQRAKWQNRADYRDRTIREALARMTEFYTPGRQGEPKEGNGQTHRGGSQGESGQAQEKEHRGEEKTQGRRGASPGIRLFTWGSL